MWDGGGRKKREGRSRTGKEQEEDDRGWRNRKRRREWKGRRRRWIRGRGIREVDAGYEGG